MFAASSSVRAVARRSGGGALRSRACALTKSKRAQFSTSKEKLDPEFTPPVAKPYPLVRNLATVGIIAGFSVASYYWTLNRMREGHDEMMDELDDVDAGFSSAGKDMSGK